MAKSLEMDGDFEEGLSILDHLNELRIHVTRAFIGLAVATIISFAFAQPLLTYLMLPYARIAPEGQAAGLQTLRPTEGIETFFKVSLLAGAVLAMPIMLHQFWLFIVPALTKKEKRSVYIFVPSAFLLFLIGIAFAWTVLLPAAIGFLFSFMTETFNPEWTAQEYLSFVTRMLFWLGVAFEMPIVIYFIARAGVMSAASMREHWRYAVVIIAILAAVITPSIDPVTMLLTMAPLLVLYVMSIFLATIGQRQFEKSTAIDV